MENIIYVIESGDTLSKIAQKFNIDMNIIARYNGISNMDNIEAGHILRIPQNYDENVYVIRSGDTLFGIAKRYCTTVEELVRLNDISDPNVITAGESIKLPNSSCANIHIVKEGDTLYSIAKMHNTIPEIIADINEIEDQDNLTVGQILLISDEETEPDKYMVRKGDKLWKIAERFNVPVTELINLNKLCDPDKLKEGQIIVIRIL